MACLLAGCAGVAVPSKDAAVAEVAAATQAFLAPLSPDLRDKAMRPLADAERTTWGFVPGRYAGVAFGDLDAAGTERLQALLRTLLSAEGLRKTMAIVQLEDVLRAIEGRSGADVSHRDPARYALLVFGEPDPLGEFALRLQGHHVSLHFTFAEGFLVGATPHFLGTNPHELREGPRAGERVLAAEEDLARELLQALDAGQRQRAVIAAQAPADVFLGPGKDAGALGEPTGLPVAAMNSYQRAIAWRLVETFAHRLRGEFAAQELARLEPGFGDVAFAWAGGLEKGQGHYWRLHGATFAVEYDNTQNDANHVHTVWRDFARDFGGDVLRRHVEEQHAGRRRDG
ncbi:MAG: DUF3500 domain-containing protein [Planctomycetes bacterium]|nr:DUF3500 domain-containing protein [Planctomycetota bacterium]